MKSHDAIRRCVNGHHEDIAKATGRSINLIYRWTLPTSDYTDSGAYNDLDRIESMIDKSLNLGTPAADALAPVYYLAQLFGGFFMPPVPRSYELKDISKQLCSAMKEAGELFAAAAAALDDDDLSNDEKKQIVKEAHDVMAEVATLTRMVEGG